MAKGVPAGTIPLVPGCLPECTHPLCRTLLTTFWIPFFVLETSKFVLSHYFCRLDAHDNSHLLTHGLQVIQYLYVPLF